jgi:hypothetical protein
MLGCPKCVLLSGQKDGAASCCRSCGEPDSQQRRVDLENERQAGNNGVGTTVTARRQPGHGADVGLRAHVLGCVGGCRTAWTRFGVCWPRRCRGSGIVGQVGRAGHGQRLIQRAGTARNYVTRTSPWRRSRYFWLRKWRASLPGNGDVRNVTFLSAISEPRNRLDSGTVQHTRRTCLAGHRRGSQHNHLHQLRSGGDGSALLSIPALGTRPGVCRARLPDWPSRWAHAVRARRPPLRREDSRGLTATWPWKGVGS